VAISFVDRCIFQARAIGLGDFVVNGAVLGYMTPAQANAVNGATYHAIAQTVDTHGNIQQWEISTGVYNAATVTQARTTIIFSSSANAKVNFVQAPQVMLTYLAEDVVTCNKGTVTLTPNATTTTVMNATIVPTSFISMAPTTPDAGNDGATTSWVAGMGQFVITHANNARVDRTFNYAVLN
jgi:hypothetical protein